MSIIWKAVLSAFSVVEEGLAWKVRNGEKVQIGKDPWVGCGDSFRLPGDLIQILHAKGTHTLNQVADPLRSSIWAQGW